MCDLQTTGRIDSLNFRDSVSPRPGIIDLLYKKKKLTTINNRPITLTAIPTAINVTAV